MGSVTLWIWVCFYCSDIMALAWLIVRAASKNGARARVSGQLYRSLGVSLWVYLTILPEAHLRTDVGQ